jgi:hypothetical protein
MTHGSATYVDPDGALWRPGRLLAKSEPKPDHKIPVGWDERDALI